MRFSHSKLSCCLNNPMDYYLSYKMGIQPKVKNKAFTIGTAVHWGLENNTSDLTKYFAEEEKVNSYSYEQFYAECMVNGYFHHKEEIMKIVFDGVNVIKEYHELPIEANLPSYTHPNEPYNFNGIIDLLFLTDKGFIIIDYKTSSQLPEWSKYLDQIYRYNFMLNSVYPKVPVYRTGIINLIKPNIKRKPNEKEESYNERVKQLYLQENTKLINVHMFDANTLDKQVVNDYINNLSRQADIADLMDKNNAYYIEYSNANGEHDHYRSTYLNIYNREPLAYLDYNIKDTILDGSQLLNTRDCIELDMRCIEPIKILNKYDTFLTELLNSGLTDKDKYFDYLKSRYVVDNELLERYWKTFQYQIKNKC